MLEGEADVAGLDAALGRMRMMDAKRGHVWP
jgi:hypothetical protein